MKISKVFIYSVFLINSTVFFAQNYVRIGELFWSQANLNVTEFKNGDPIQEAKNSDEWESFFKQAIPAYCSLNYNSKNDSIHGKIYNWFAVVDRRGLAPEGFKVPSLEDWMKLRFRLNYDTICKCIPPIMKAGQKLKSSSEWRSDTKGENLFNMNILPSGYLKNDGLIEGRFLQVSYWTSTPDNAAGVIGDSYSTYYAIFNHQNTDITFDKNFDANGHFVRCATGEQEYLFSPMWVNQSVDESKPNVTENNSDVENSDSVEEEKPRKKKKKKKKS